MNNLLGVAKHEFNRVAFVMSGHVTAFRRAVSSGLAFLPPTVLSKSEIFGYVGPALKQGYMERYQALAFMSANVVCHEDSGFNEHEYLGRAIGLYNAQTLTELLFAENIHFASVRHDEVMAVYNSNQNDKRTKKLSHAKEYCYTRDIIQGTRGRFLGRLRHRSERFTEADIGDLILKNKPANDSVKPLIETSEGKKSTSAFDIQDILPKLRIQKMRGVMSDAQCGLFLCFILHARERRKSDQSYYANHPMAVAGMVQKFGPAIYKDDEFIWKASLVALLHDIGEKNDDFDVRHDLKGLVPDDVADAVALLHKPDDQSYFAFIDHIAKDPLASFVKLCDIIHNSDKTGPTAIKQKYVYTLAAAYLQEMIECPEQMVGVTLKEFAIAYAGYTEDEYLRIEKMTEKGNKDTGEGLHVKVPAVTDYILNHLGHSKQSHADPRRKENSSLQRRADV